MNRLLTLSTLLTLLAVTGCATTASRRMHAISSGMEKREVIKILGYPLSTKTEGNVQVLHYRDDKGAKESRYSYVRLVNDRVESFGPETKENRVTATNPPLKSQP